ncbi:MAG: T9SS type A sorting domain-containing protein, partial [Ignavibacteria bacterium]|nr:T9SS type A sorting domain-containing protein [Ignavibacteria bacterium]
TKSELLIFPNPVEDFLEISEPSEGSANAIKIFNVFGEEILKISDSNNSQFPIPNSQFRINVSGLPSGMYFVRIGNKVSKFVKI